MSKRNAVYNADPFNRPRGRRNRSFLGMLFVILLLALTMSFSVALIIAYLTPYVSPSTFGSLTIVGIFAPILYICVAACMLLWVILGYWKSAAAVFIILIPGLFRLSDFYSIDFMREAEQKNDKRLFRPS